jgi:hypothetical protein
LNVLVVSEFQSMMPWLMKAYRKDHTLGMHHTEESKRRLSERFSGKNNPQYGKRGKDSPAWKGGTVLLWHIKALPEYVKWRRAIYRRDGYKCTECGDDSGHNLIAHHIKPFATIMRENKIYSVDAARDCAELWNINNGITLCIPCHKETKTYGWRL